MIDSRSKPAGQGQDAKQDANFPTLDVGFLAALRRPGCPITTLRVYPLGYTRRELAQPSFLALILLLNSLVENRSVQVLNFAELLKNLQPQEQIQFLQTLAEVLQVNRTIKAVFLNDNPIPHEGALALATALKQSHIHQLEMGGCQFSTFTDILQIADEFHKNPHFVCLNLENCIPIEEFKRNPWLIKKIHEKNPKKLLLDDTIKIYLAELKQEEQAFARVNSAEKQLSPVHAVRESFFPPVPSAERKSNPKQNTDDRAPSFYVGVAPVAPLLHSRIFHHRQAARAEIRPKLVAGFKVGQVR